MPPGGYGRALDDPETGFGRAGEMSLDPVALRAKNGSHSNIIAQKRQKTVKTRVQVLKMPGRLSMCPLIFGR